MRIKNVRLAAILSTLALALQLGAQAPQLSKEYIYLDSRLIAVDGPPAAPPAPANLLPSAITLTSASSSNRIGVTATGAWNVPTNPTSWMTITSQTGSGNGDIIFSVSQNSGAQRTATFNIAGMPFTITQRQAGAPASPPTVSVSTAEAASGFFTFKATSPYGGAYINYLQSNLNVVHDFREACYFLVQLDGRVYLATDTGAQWQDNGYVGTSRTIGNSQCSINLGASTVSISGNDLVAHLKITYQSIFAGTKRFFMAAADNGGISTVGYWVDTNTDYIPNPAPAMLLTANQPTADSTSGNAFRFTFQIKNTNQFGRDFISGALMLINSNLDGGTACWISYSRVDNGFYMLNSGQYGKPGDSNPLVSPQCTLYLSTLQVTLPDSQTIVISAFIRFPDPQTSAFQFPGVLGTTNSWILAKDRAGRDGGWVQSASPITVNNVSPSAPTYDSPPDNPANWNGPPSSVVQPNLTKGVFYTFNVNEPNTGNYMNWSQIYMGPEGANTKGLCYFLYSNLDDRIYLAYANSLQWKDSASRTDGRVLDNGICRIKTGAATTALARNAIPGKLSVSLTIEFYNSHMNTDPLNSAPGENPSIWNTMIGYIGNHAIRFYSQNRAGVGNAIPWSALDNNNVWP